MAYGRPQVLNIQYHLLHILLVTSFKSRFDFRDQLDSKVFPLRIGLCCYLWLIIKYGKNSGSFNRVTKIDLFLWTWMVKLRR